jgi:thioesterase domain-containing protein/acyl carrier protein
MLKSPPSAARVLDPKVHGTLVLEEALRNLPLSCFVLFSSISSIFPPPGQVDYAAANAFLDAFALSRKGPVTVINWGAWGGTGMVARSAFPHSLLEKRLLATPGEIVFSSRLSLEKHWLLSEHRLKTGKALIPGTGYLEMAVGAFTGGSFSRPVALENVFFISPLMFAPSEPRDVRTQLRREQGIGKAKEAFRFAVLSKNGSSQTGPWVEHAAGNIEPCLTRPPSRVDRVSITAQCQEREIVFDEQHRTRQERYFNFGPRWGSLKRLRIGKGQGIAELQLDRQFSADSSAFCLHPALLDMATGCALYLIDGYDTSDDLYLPFSYKRMCVYRRIPATCFSHIRSRQENLLHSEVETFDITLFDHQDQVLVEIEGFTMRRIADPAKATEEDPWAREAALHGDEQRPIEIDEQFGIPPLDGVQALTRILLTATPTAVVVVSQVPEDLRDRSPKPSPRAISGAGAKVAQPGEDVENALASWWQELLGIEKVGLNDDFFGLGGHSLIGVRLFAKIKKTYQVDLELAVLFEARTVHQLADLIRKSMQPAAAEKRTWSALVPIQPRGSRIPLFFIHAVGGDVLFYEQLTKALGPDQPFYAFKSPLVSQVEVPETSLEELASIYVKELRAFFPQGPYLLGGASLGGHIAFEMARQLDAQGLRPELLVLIDASVPGTAKRVDVKDRIPTFLHNLRKDGPAYLMQKAAAKRGYWGKLLLESAERLGCSIYRLAGRPLPLGLHLFQVEQAHIQALRRYTIRNYAGKVTLMRAIHRGEILSRREDPTLGWGQFAGGGLEIHDVPSGHISMLFEPYVQKFSESLKAILPS